MRYSPVLVMDFTPNPITPTLKLPFPCPILTRFLQGGIPIGSITEITGESGSGKTQFCLHLLSSVPAPSLFIHSEFPFPLRRLYQLSQSHTQLDRIFISAAHSATHLLTLLSEAVQIPNLKLVIIDSIAALFRSEYDNNWKDLKKRSGLFFQIAGRLKEMARRLGLAVVVTNQVMDAMGDDGGCRVGNYEELWSSGRRVWPALGLSWAHCVNMRLFLSRWDDDVVKEDDECWREGCELGGARTTRTIKIVFAPHLGKGEAEFVIVKEGVFGVSL